MFIENNIRKPFFLKVILKIMYILNTYSIIILISIFFVFVIIKSYQKTRSGKIFFDKVIIKIPILNKFLCMSIASEFISTLAILLNGGLSLSYSLDVSKNISKNHFIKLQINNMCNAIKNGEKISLEMSKLNPPLFSLIVIQMIKVGEKTGNLEKSLEIASVFIKQEIRDNINIFIKLLGPILIVFIGCFIGLIMLTTILPLFKIYNFII
jgi:type IV pilus assembly protein PilC